MRILMGCEMTLCLTLFASSISAQGLPDKKPKDVSMRGRVLSIEIKELDKSSAGMDIKLEIEFVNYGSNPIIFLKREPLFPAGALARIPEDFEIGNVLASSSFWPSNDDSPEWAEMRANLDKAKPPAGETRLLKPRESWLVETSVKVVVPTNLLKYISSQKSESLATIQKLSPVWLQVDCEIWPLNLEPFNRDRNKLKFGHKLQERWKDHGLLWLHDISSEPILIDVKTASYTALKH